MARATASSTSRSVARAASIPSRMACSSPVICGAWATSKSPFCGLVSICGPPFMKSYDFLFAFVFSTMLRLLLGDSIRRILKGVMNRDELNEILGQQLAKFAGQMMQYTDTRFNELRDDMNH